MRIKLSLILILSFITFFILKMVNDNKLVILETITGVPTELLLHLKYSPWPNFQSRTFNVLPLEVTLTNITSELSMQKSLFFSVENIGDRKTIVDFVINDKDWTSSAKIADTALKDIPKNSLPEMKSLALWRYVEQNIISSFPIIDNLTFSQLNSAVLLFNSFGFGNCGNFASILTTLADEAGLKSRRVDLEDHSVTEIFYDNSWHLFDSNLGIIIRNADGSIASVEEIFKNPKLLNQVKLFPQKYPGSHMVFENALSKKTVLKYFSPILINFFLPKNTPKNATYFLRPNEKITFFRDLKYSFLKNYVDFNPLDLTPMKNYTNGILTTPVNNFTLDNSSIISVSLPFPIVESYVYFGRKCDNQYKVFVSKDKIDWDESISVSKCLVKLSRDFFYTEKGGGTIDKYYLKLNQNQFLESQIKIFTIFQLSPNSIPSLNTENNILKIDSGNITSKLKLTFGIANN